MPKSQGNPPEMSRATIANKSKRPGHPLTQISQQQSSSPANSSLTATLTLLHLLHHRNKNQHRRSKWWKWLCLLRRHLAKLSVEREEVAGLSANPLLLRLVDRGKVALKGRNARSKLTAFTDHPGLAMETRRDIRSEKEAREARVQQRQSYLKRIVLPGCYLAFSNLVREPQFAQVGVVLMGCLGDVGMVLGSDGDLGELEEAGSEGATIVDRVEVGWNRKALDRRTEGRSGEDLGEVVDRKRMKEEEEGLNVGLESVSGVEDVNRKERNLIGGSVSDNELKRKGRKKRRRKGDAIDDLFSMLD